MWYNGGMSSCDKSLEVINVKKPANNQTIDGTPPPNRSNISACDSLNETGTFTVRVELPLEDYAALAKRAAQEGVTPEQLMAQAVGKMLE